MALSAAVLALAPLLALGAEAPPVTAQHAGPPRGPAPAALYPLDGDARDATGQGDDGRVEGARPAEDRAGRPGAALAFSGRDLVDLGRRTEPGTLTVMAWVRPSRLSRDGAILSKAAPAAGRDRWLELRVEADGRPALLLPSMERPLRGPRLLAEGRWSHLAATFDGARAVLYVDGAPVADAPAARWPTAPGQAALGARPEPGGKLKRSSAWLEGRLDDVRLYTEALPAWEVLAVVHPGSRPPAPGPDGDELADDAGDLERIGALAAAFDRAVVRRDQVRLREVEAKVRAEIDQELAEARTERGHGASRRDVARRARDLFAGPADLRDLNDLDGRRSAIAELSAAAWQELMDDLRGRGGPGPRPERRPRPDEGGPWGPDRRDHQGPPAPQPAPPAARAMEPARFEAVLAAARREPFADGQRRVLQTALPGNWFTVEQVGRMVDLFTFTPDKLDVIKRAQGRIVDPEEGYRLYERFSFESEKEEVRKLLAP